MPMTFEEFQHRTHFGRDEILAYARGELIRPAKADLPSLPNFLLLPFHEIAAISWDESSQKGRIEAVRYNRLDDWFYACHFLGDPVMPGCWGIDAVWQCLKFFAAWRGFPGCGKTLGLESVSFFGQIRPRDQKITYSVDIASIERSSGAVLITGKAAVHVDGVPVYAIGSAQIGTDYWEDDAPLKKDAPPPLGRPMVRKLSYDEFAASSSLSHEEVIAISQGTLIADSPAEMGLLPSSLMLGIDEVHHISYDENLDEGRISASQNNVGLEWFYPMNGGEKPTALTIDSVWQLLGLFLAWRKELGTGRALGFERVEIFDAIRPQDRRILYEVQVRKVFRAAGSEDLFVRADASVFADGRLILKCENASVGCHKNIRYSDYPQTGEMAFGGKLRTRNKGAGV